MSHGMRTDYVDSEGNKVLVVHLWDFDVVDCAMCGEPTRHGFDVSLGTVARWLKARARAATSACASRATADGQHGMTLCGTAGPSDSNR
jgi:hypothetical protein